MRFLCWASVYMCTLFQCMSVACCKFGTWRWYCMSQTSCRCKEMHAWWLEAPNQGTLPRIPSCKITTFIVAFSRFRFYPLVGYIPCVLLWRPLAIKHRNKQSLALTCRWMSKCTWFKRGRAQKNCANSATIPFL